VRELHERLVALGVNLDDTSDVFDATTVAHIEAFQRSRGLPITGEVDATTFGRLGEAGWRLGQRLLYLTSPHQRGDDVAEVQVLLAQLGFNPGRIDGIFGAVTAAALTDFQRNCALDESGTMTKATLQGLERVRASRAPRSLVTDARDLAGFDPQRAGSILLCGSGPVAEALARSLGDAVSVHVLLGESPTDAADFANAHDVALVLSIQPVDELEGLHLHYWASYRSHSRLGEVLASGLASQLALLPDVPRVEVTGMALPILRETKMTTVHVEHGTLAEQVLHQAITAIGAVVSQVIHRPA
jgi:N-acetylmuramoyl-L-alanine amidase